MIETYESIEVISNPPDIPAWSTTWPGSSGCNSRTVYYSSPIGFTNPPASTKKFYEPEVTREQKDPRRIKGRRSGFPPYRYTDYWIQRTTTRKGLVRRQFGSAGRNVFYQYGIVPKIGGACVATPTRLDSTGPLFSSWYQVTDESSYGGYTNYTLNGFNSDDLNTALNQVEDDVVQEALSVVDVLSNIAEARELPGLVTSIAGDLSKILRTLRNAHNLNIRRAAARLRPIDLLKHPYKAMRKFGDEWMQYRYGIMPLVYTYRDAMKAADRKHIVKTRKSQTVSPRSFDTNLPPSSSLYRVTEWSGTVKYSGNVYQAFTSDEVSRLSGQGFNPLVTAWELIPYSFVLDWFVNIGDYIGRKTSTSLARQLWACLSRREQSIKTIYIHLPSQDQSVAITNSLPNNFIPPNPPATPNVVLANPEGRFMLSQLETDAYTRWNFDIRGAQLRVNPSLNWRRYVDSAVMANNQLRALIKAFKGH